MTLEQTLQPYAHQLLWDYSLTLGEYVSALRGERQGIWFGQDWALTRALERLPYYTVLETVPLSTLALRWPTLRGKLRDERIQSAYDFVLQQYALSTAGQSPSAR